jgi:hypothetical protein
MPVSSRGRLIQTFCRMMCMLVFCLPLFAERKDDVIIMKNGERMSGEIKYLDGPLVLQVQLHELCSPARLE